MEFCNHSCTVFCFWVSGFLWVSVSSGAQSFCVFRSEVFFGARCFWELMLLGTPLSGGAPRPAGRAPSPGVSGTLARTLVFCCDLRLYFLLPLCFVSMVGHWDQSCFSVGPSPCFAGCGTRLRFFIIFVSFIHSISGVCIHCKDSIPGCTGGTNCPTIADVTANAQIFTTAALGSVPKAANLLPHSLLQYFPRHVMEMIVATACAPVGGARGGPRRARGKGR